MGLEKAASHRINHNANSSSSVINTNHVKRDFVRSQTDTSLFVGRAIAQAVPGNDSGGF